MTPTPSDPTGNYQDTLQLLQLTDELNGTASFDSTATIINLVLEPGDGLLDRLADFFEAAGEKVRESDHDDAFDLSADFNDAAAHARQIGEDLHVAVDRMRTLQSHPPHGQPAPLTAVGVPSLPPKRATGPTR